MAAALTILANITLLSVEMTEIVNKSENPTWVLQHSIVNSTVPPPKPGPIVVQTSDTGSKVLPVFKNNIRQLGKRTINETLTAEYIDVSEEPHINPFYGQGSYINWTLIERNPLSFKYYIAAVDLGETSLADICLNNCYCVCT